MKINYYLIVIIGLMLLGAGCTNTGSAPTAMQPNGSVSDSVQDELDLSEQEKGQLVLNFIDTQVVFTGYPYINSKVVPRLYSLMYIGTMVNDETAIVNQLTNDPDGGWMPVINSSGLWSGIYEVANKEPKIFIPIGLSAANAPIWQTMEIIQQADIATSFPGCATSEYELVGDSMATVVDCAVTDANRTYATNKSCYLPVDGASGILYRQYSTDASTGVNMCEILKDNGVISAEYKAY